MTWAADGRATFEHGPEQIAGEAHVRWRRIGDHSIFAAPWLDGAARSPWVDSAVAPAAVPQPLVLRASVGFTLKLKRRCSLARVARARDAYLARWMFDVLGLDRRIQREF
jgi:hypothetical protein